MIKAIELKKQDHLNQVISRYLLIKNNKEAIEQIQSQLISKFKLNKKELNSNVYKIVEVKKDKGFSSSKEQPIDKKLKTRSDLISTSSSIKCSIRIRKSKKIVWLPFFISYYIRFTKWIYNTSIQDHWRSTMPSVNLSNYAVLLNLIDNLGFMLLESSFDTLLELIVFIVAKPFLLKICDIFETNDMDYPIPSIWIVPCFLRINLLRKTPWFSLESLRTR